MTQPQDANDPNESIVPPARPPGNEGTETSMTIPPREDGSTFSLPGGKATMARTADGEPAVPRFILHDVIGRGGVGEVWESTQTALERTVAVKRIVRERTGEGSSHSRSDRTGFLDYQFRHEAIITAHLEHPNIVPVYDLGYDEEQRPQLAMKLVRGIPWPELIAADAENLPFEEFLPRHLQILIEVSQAVAFAHSRGIVHRDLKPSQVMVGEFGEVLVMDWGLAMMAHDPAPGQPGIHCVSVRIPDKETALNPAGTPSLMAPEQTVATAAFITARTDVYLLGGTLYFLLSGRYPHQAETRDLALARASEGKVDPPRPRSSLHKIPPQLSRLAMWALAKNPEDRPADTSVFVRELKDYLTGASARRESGHITEGVAKLLDGIHVSRSGDGIPTPHGPAPQSLYQHLTAAINQLEKGVELWPRNPEITGLRNKALSYFTGMALAQGDLTLAQVMAGRISDQGLREVLNEATAARRRKQLTEKRQRLAGIIAAGFLVLLLAGGGWRYWSDQRAAFERTAMERDRAEEARRAAEKEQYFSAIAIAEASLREYRAGKTEEALLGRTPPTFRNWEWGYLLSRINMDRYRIGGADYFALAFAPGGGKYVVGGRESLEIRDTETGALIRDLSLFDQILWSADWSPDGRWIGVASFDGNAYLVDVGTGAIAHTLQAGALQRATAFRPDSSAFLSGGRDLWLTLHDVETGETIRRFGPFAQDVYAARFTPEGDRIVAASLSGSSSLWDVESGAMIHEVPGEGFLLALDISPDGTLYADAGRDGRIRLIDLESGTIIRQYPEGPTQIHALAFTGDGRHLVSSDDHGACHVWSVETGELVASHPTFPRFFHVRVQPGGGGYFAGAGPGILSMTSLDYLLGTNRGKPDPSAEERAKARARVRAYGVPPSRDSVWAARERPWNTASGLSLQEARGTATLVQSRWTAFSPGGETVVHIDGQGNDTVVRDARSGEELLRPGNGPHMEAAFSPDGDLLVIAAMENRLDVYRTSDWEHVHTLVEDPDADGSRPHRDRYHINSLAFRPGSHLLAVGYLNSTVSFWDVETGLRSGRIGEPEGIGISLAFSPAGEWLAMGTNTAHVHLYSMENGRIGTTLTGHQRTVISAAFSPDASRIVTTSTDRTAKVWDVESGRELVNLLTVRSPESPLGAAFSGDGREVHILTINGVTAERAYPWRAEEYPGGPSTPLAQRIEEWKRTERSGIPPGAAPIRLP